MCSKLLRIEYKDIVTFLKKSNFSNRRDSEILSYKKNNIIVKIDEKEISVLDLFESRTYTFTKDTSTELLIEFLTFLNNQYKITI